MCLRLQIERTCAGDQLVERQAIASWIADASCGRERMRILSEKTGVFRCRTTFNCTDACPRGIQVTKAIQEVKRAILFERF